jgi:hypothetical protein
MRIARRFHKPRRLRAAASIHPGGIPQVSAVQGENQRHPRQSRGRSNALTRPKLGRTVAFRRPLHLGVGVETGPKIWG